MQRIMSVRKGLHLLLVSVLLSGALILVWPAQDASAMLFIVVDPVPLDEIDMTPGDGVCFSIPSGVCTLRAAIMEANASPGPDTIDIPHAGYIYPLVLAGPGEDAAFSGDLDITDTLSITGLNPADTLIDGVALDRVFHVDPGVSGITVTLENMTITNGDQTAGAGIRNMGDLTLVNVNVISNVGSGVYNDGGSLNLTSSDVSLNTGAGIESFHPSMKVNVTSNGGNVVGNGGWGISGTNTSVSMTGGMVTGNGGAGIGGNGIDVTLTGVDISGNSGAVDGGGLYLVNVNVPSTITNCTITGNSATGKGGGVYAWAFPGGPVTITGGEISSNTALDGGGVYVESGSVTLDNVSVTDNLADEDGGGAYVDTGDTLNVVNGTAIGTAAHGNVADADVNLSGTGGGIYNLGTVIMDSSVVHENQGSGISSQGTLDLTDSEVSYNTEAGIDALSAGITLDNTDLLSNGSYGISGAATSLVMTYGTIAGSGESGVWGNGLNFNLYGVSIEGNNATFHGGGGLYVNNVFNSTISHSTISGNGAVGHGGGIYYHGLGGGILAITNSTISGNSTPVDGGGIYIESGPASTLTLSNVTLTENVADDDANDVGSGGGISNTSGALVNFKNTILAGNEDHSAYIAAYQGPECAGSLNSGGYNFIGEPNPILCTIAGDLTGNKEGAFGFPLNPNLGPLTDNGGPTDTHAVLVGSGAIDAGNPGGCTDYLALPITDDQRGEPRPQRAACDMGAYESDLFNCANVSEIPQAECEALVDLYNSTTGESWTDNTDWLASFTPCSWFGVGCSGGHVTLLSLPTNNLVGTIPSSISDLPSLVAIYMQFNTLSGGIPGSVGLLTNLVTLKLEDNDLTGSIPPEVGDLTSLEYLYLWGNQLSGSIPADLGDLTNLALLWLGENQLTGSIPPQLGNLSNLEWLDLGDNELSGTIPSALGSCTALTDLRMHQNHLSGSIPGSIGNLTSLNALHLYSNQLDGSIPSTIGSLTALSQLGLHSNALEGDIPSSITSLTSLNPANTDLGYNKLTASDPSVITFMGSKDPDWTDTQTIPLGDVVVSDSTTISLDLSWTPIPYTGDGGYYRVSFSGTPGGPYSVHGTTADKSATGYLLDGLNPNKDVYVIVETFTPAHGSQQNDLWSDPSSELSAHTPRAPVDFNYDGESDVVVFRAGAWRTFDYTTATFDHGVWTGTSAGCIPAPLDYDGDGEVEPSQLCSGSWHFYNDDGSYNKGIWTGGVAGDLPVPADYDGDGTDDVVVWRAGAWRFFDFTSGAFDHGVWTGSPPHWLGGTNIPAPMDYDGDGAAEFTVFSGGPWHFYNDDGTYNKGIWTGGVTDDLPVPGDYDGDGTDDVVVWRAGAWRFFDFTTAAFDHGVWTGMPAHWLGGTSLPAPLDVDGDGHLDFSVFSGGPWHFYNADGSYDKGIWTGGVAGDTAISRRLLP